MDERRFRVALEELDKSIKEFGVDTFFSAFGVICERHGYDLSRRDPGPCCCDYGDFYEREGVMPPRHDCPAPAPSLEDLVGPEDVLGNFIVSVSPQVKNNILPGRWS